MILPYKKIEDNTIMPFGKFAGREIEFVPASYLLWLNSEIIKKANEFRTLFQRGIVVYCHQNKRVLEKQAKEERSAKYK